MKFKAKILLTSLLCTLSFSLFTPATKEVYAQNQTPPSIVGKYAITMDYDTGEIIYAKDVDGKAYPASTTKLITGLLFAEHMKRDDVLRYTQDALNQPEYSLNKNFKMLTVGDTMTANDVMESLLLFSANDAAYMIADAVSGNVNNFKDLMNSKVKELGLKNTHFVTPNGLHNDDHYSTAYDLTVIGRAAYENPWVQEVMQLKNATVQASNGKHVNIENRNRYIGQDGNIGGKTGYTSKAQRCLVSINEKNGRKIIGTVLFSQYDSRDETVFNDMKKLMNYSFSNEKSIFLKKGEVIDTIPVEYKAFKFFGPKKTIDVPIILNEDITYYENDVNKKEFSTSVDIKNIDAWKLAANSDSPKIIASQRLYNHEYSAKADIGISSLIKANFLLYLITFVSIILIIFIILLIIRGINMRKRKRRRNRIF